MPHTEFQSLPCELTNDEKMIYGQTNAREVELAMRVEDEKKEAMAVFKSRIEGHHNEVKRLSHIVSSGIEYRKVECEKTLNFATGKTTITRLDTKETVQVRDMTPEEQQRSFDLM